MIFLFRIFFWKYIWKEKFSYSYHLAITSIIGILYFVAQNNPWFTLSTLLIMDKPYSFVFHLQHDGQFDISFISWSLQKNKQTRTIIFLNTFVCPSDEFARLDSLTMHSVPLWNIYLNLVSIVFVKVCLFLQSNA